MYAIVGSFVSILAISTWTQIRPRAFYGLWSMVNTTNNDWYSRVRNDDERIGPVLAGSLQEANFSHLLEKPGNVHVSDDRVEMTDPRSRSGFFLWLLKLGTFSLPFQKLVLYLTLFLYISKLTRIINCR